MKALLCALGLLIVSAAGVAPCQANAQSLSKPDELANTAGNQAVGEETSQIDPQDAGEIGPDLESARQRLNGIVAQARKISTLEPASPPVPSDDQIGAMSLGEIADAARSIAMAAVEAIKTSSESAGGKDANGTADSLDQVYVALLDATTRGDDPGDSALRDRIEEIVDQADAAIDETTRQDKESLKQLTANASVAAEVVSEVNALLASIGARQDESVPVSGVSTEEPTLAPGGSSLLETLLGWLPIGLLTLLALTVGGYSLYLRGQNRSLIDENTQLRAKVANLSRDVDNEKLKVSQVQEQVKEARAEASSERERTMRLAEEQSALKATSRAPDEPRRAAPQPKRNTQIPLLQRDLEAYLSGGGKLRASPYREILQKYGSIYGVTPGEAGMATLQDDQTDQQRHVTAVCFEDSREIAIVPSAYFISKFSMQFSRELEVSEETKAFFEIQSGSGNSLSIGKVATGTLAGEGDIRQIQKGMLRGFS